MTDDELNQVQERYARRGIAGVVSRYDPLMTVNLCFRQEKERAVSALLNQWLAGRHLGDLDILEIGCGSGDNLLQLIQWGADPARMIANELLPDRVALARARLPQSVSIMPGDASKLDLPPASLDMIVQSTVFSSILDKGLRQRVVDHTWDLVRPGGAYLWYDFTYDNPKNRDVRGIRYSEVSELFPADALIEHRRITLAPPLARKVAPLGRHIYNALASLKVLNTHVAAMIWKPAVSEVS